MCSAGAGVWAVYPTVFLISYFCGVFHCSITAILSIITFSSFFLAAFRHAGRSANVEWGRYPIVGQGGLENYTFCLYCRKPKCPRTHHCRSCRTCVFDMDHHCPFVSFLSNYQLIFLIINKYINIEENLPISEAISKVCQDHKIQRIEIVWQYQNCISDGGCAFSVCTFNINMSCV